MADIDIKQTPLFVIAIGGTGMRCLESFVHLCAIGMFDNRNINILTLDTDFGNGNKGRVETLIDNYVSIKEGKGKTGNPNVNTFFSSSIKLFKYATNYNDNGRRSYVDLSANAKDKEDNQDLASLFLDSNVQNFDLAHGFRAQTHLGSMLMYHSILESARNNARGNVTNNRNKDLDSALCSFLKELSAANKPRVFIFGSIFGGTGASSIPIIPVAFQKAVEVMASITKGNETFDFNQVYFGSSLLTDYFTFNAPTAQQKKIAGNQVIADSANFALNCQAALDFYNLDKTVRQVYKRFYNIGWPLIATKFGENSPGEVLTGGNKQLNNCHVVELMCACAAYDFFTLPDNELKELKFCYRSPKFEENFRFWGKDFMDKDGDLFTNKLGAFLSFAHLALSRYKGAWSGTNGVKGFLKFFQDQDITDYNINDDWNEYEMNKVNEYLKKFAYSFDSNNNMIPGWLFQVYESAKSSKFIFDSITFEEGNIRSKDVDPGLLFDDDNKQHNWDKTGLISNRINTLGKKLKEKDTNDFKTHQKDTVSTTEERFLAHIYNGITKAQKFNN